MLALHRTITALHRTQIRRRPVADAYKLARMRSVSWAALNLCIWAVLYLCIPQHSWYPVDAIQISKFQAALPIYAGISSRPLPLAQYYRPPGKFARSFSSKTGRSASPTSPLFTSQSESEVSEGVKRRALATYIAPWARPLVVFGLGYVLGGASAPGWQRHERVTSKIGVTKIALALLIARDVWRSTPQVSADIMVVFSSSVSHRELRSSCVSSSIYFIANGLCIRWCSGLSHESLDMSRKL